MLSRHYLIVNHYFSMSWFKFRNLSEIVNCVTESLNTNRCLSNWQSMMIRGLQGIGSPDELFILFLFLPSLPTSQTEIFQRIYGTAVFKANRIACDIYFLIILIKPGHNKGVVWFLLWTYPGHVFLLAMKYVYVPSTQSELSTSYYCFKSMSHPIRGDLIQIIPTWSVTIRLLSFWKPNLSIADINWQN